MQDTKAISQYDLYFFAKGAAEAVVKAAALINPLVEPRLGPGWADKLTADANAYRAAVEKVIREATDTSDAIRTAEQLMQNVSTWRELASGIAFNGPPARRAALLKATGYGDGTARSVKEMKDLLLNIKSRLEVYGPELTKLGLDPALLTLPARVLAKLESGAGDVAREKAEESLARADVAELFDRVATTLNVAWRAVDLTALQSALLVERDDATAEEKAKAQARVKDAGSLAVHLEKTLGEARVEARTSAAATVVPPGLVGPGAVVEPEAKPET